MDPAASHPASHVSIQRLDFGRVSVFFGEKSGKYPDGNQVLIHGSDMRAAFDTPIVCWSNAPGHLNGWAHINRLAKSHLLWP
ncbi:hypothetical protein SAMN05444352_107192 [Pseudomonas japonica]|uniref:Uncharacterized protein n=1 Tax=Pseudomonas japonica TaxID=256466 RepID=A0A239EBI6_9PSED|nr:hypothetical protein SAMN05444352_107192 [Pseudomonas japonica]